jgi:hypothetical protein
VVPLRGQPDFEAELGKNRADHAAERGNRARGDSASAEYTGRNRGGRTDRNSGQREPIQFLTALGLREDWTGSYSWDGTPSEEGAGRPSPNLSHADRATQHAVGFSHVRGCLVNKIGLTCGLSHRMVVRQIAKKERKYS